MGLSFRTARKLWMGVIALLSLVSIFLAVVLWIHGYGRSSNIGALVAIPCFAFVGALWTMFKKMLFTPQAVCVEATWVFALLPFQILLGLFAFESKVALRPRFMPAYQILSALVWVNAVLVFLYTGAIISLAVLTHLSYDREIWARDIDSSPCPFPFPVLLVYVFPFAAKYVPGAVADSQAVAPDDYCLPGCPCHTKPTVASGPDAEGADYITGTQTSIPIRVPTMMERHNAIRVTLGSMARS